MSANLILGNTGFVGRHLTRTLADAGHAVSGVDVVQSRQQDRRFQTHIVDLFAVSDADLATLIAPYDVIYFLAWSSIPATADLDPAGDIARNVGLMIRILELLRNSGKRMVFTASGGTVYGRNSAWRIDERQSMQPISAYGAAKASAELYAGAFRSAYGVDVRIARISNPYGAGQSQLRPQGAVSRFTFDALAGKSIDIWGDGSVVRDYIHVQDVVDGLNALASVPPGQLGDNATFNIGSGEGVSLNDIVALLQQVVGQSVAVRYLPGRAFDVERNVLDVTAARTTFGWSPAIDLRSGIERMVWDLRHNPETLFSGVAAAASAEAGRMRVL